MKHPKTYILHACRCTWTVHAWNITESHGFAFAYLHIYLHILRISSRTGGTLCGLRGKYWIFITVQCKRIETVSLSCEITSVCPISHKQRSSTFHYHAIVFERILQLATLCVLNFEIGSNNVNYRGLQPTF